MISRLARLLGSQRQTASENRDVVLAYFERRGELQRYDPPFKRCRVIIASSPPQAPQEILQQWALPAFHHLGQLSSALVEDHGRLDPPRAVMRLHRRWREYLQWYGRFLREATAEADAIAIGSPPSFLRDVSRTFLREMMKHSLKRLNREQQKVVKRFRVPDEISELLVLAL